MPREPTDQDFIRELPNIGEGSEFRYETVVVPTVLENLRTMLSDLEKSSHNLTSRLKGPIDENGRTTAVLFRRSERKRLSEQFDEIMSAESDIISMVHGILDHGCDESAVYVISSTLNTVRKVNMELGRILDRAETHPSLSDVADCLRELEIQRSMIDRIVPCVRAAWIRE